MQRVAIGFILGALLLAFTYATGVAQTIQAIVQCETTDEICLGGEGNDTIDGTEEADEIWAGGGNDSVDARGGEDTVYGQKGNDLILGENGNDPNLQGNAGDDDVYGEDGDDTVSGNAGQDYLEGNRGDDVLAGGENNDDIDARGDLAGQEDFVYGGPGNDEINSQDGVKDTIQCGSGTDTVFHDAIDVVAADCENKSTGAPPADFLEEQDL